LDDRTLTPFSLFDEAIDWLREHYNEYEFWAERDLVWTVQTRLRRMIADRQLPLSVFNDYPLLPRGEGRESDSGVRRPGSHTHCHCRVRR
jgi:hypothetical protein